MIEKKFPFPGEVLSENHQFRTSKPPIHGFSILAGRMKKPPRGSKRQSLRIENSEPPALSSINSRFSRGEENKKPPRHSQLTQPLRIENSEPPHPLVTNSRFSRGEGREAKSVQDAPEENIFRTNVRAIAPPSFTRLKIQQEDRTNKNTFYTQTYICLHKRSNSFNPIPQWFHPA